jgi:predicted cupin superfamily sugar epimerase
MALPCAGADISTRAEAPSSSEVAGKLIAHYHMQRIPLLLHPDGHGRKVILGANVLAGELPQFTVPRAVWQGSTPRGTSPQRHALFGDQLSPAFLYEDFEVGYRDALQQRRRLELI